jgi:hypothetical protein
MNGNFFTIKEVSEWMLMIGLLSYVSDCFVRLLRPIRSCFCLMLKSTQFLEPEYSLMALALHIEDTRLHIKFQNCGILVF